MEYIAVFIIYFRRQGLIILTADTKQNFFAVLFFILKTIKFVRNLLDISAPLRQK